MANILAEAAEKDISNMCNIVKTNTLLMLCMSESNLTDSVIELNRTEGGKSRPTLRIKYQFEFQNDE